MFSSLKYGDTIDKCLLRSYWIGICLNLTIALGVFKLKWT